MSEPRRPALIRAEIRDLSGYIEGLAAFDDYGHAYRLRLSALRKELADTGMEWVSERQTRMRGVIA